jgi:hypothetical protein
MVRQKNKKNSGPAALRRSMFGVFTLALFAGLFIAALYLVVGSNQVEKGQLIPGQTASLSGFSHSLDLRVAARNTYPSDALTIVQDLGAANGVSKKIISFRVAPDGLTEYGLLALPDRPAQAFRR